MVSWPDLLITVAYFSIPVQMVVSLSLYPRLHNMPLTIRVLIVLFALFIFLCGAGHLLHTIGMGDSLAHYYVNICTGFVSVLTACYLLPLVPSVLGQIDEGLKEISDLNLVSKDLQEQLVDFLRFLCREIRNPLVDAHRTVSKINVEKLSPEEAASLKEVTNSLFQMMRLVNSVMEKSRERTGINYYEFVDEEDKI